jgi:hypothetical protein
MTAQIRKNPQGWNSEWVVGLPYRLITLTSTRVQVNPVIGQIHGAIKAARRQISSPRREMFTAVELKIL